MNEMCVLIITFIKPWAGPSEGLKVPFGFRTSRHDGLSFEVPIYKYEFDCAHFMSLVTSVMLSPFRTLISSILLLASNKTNAFRLNEDQKL
jgi:hypothetical protein